MFAALEFDIAKAATKLPKQMKYSLRLSHTVGGDRKRWRTEQTYPNFQAVGPRKDEDRYRGRHEFKYIKFCNTCTLLLINGMGLYLLAMNIAVSCYCIGSDSELYFHLQDAQYVNLLCSPMKQ